MKKVEALVRLCEGREVFRERHSIFPSNKRFGEYCQLITNLHNREIVTLAGMERMLFDDHQLLVFARQPCDKIVGTGQASLLLPAGQPVAHIGEVVVSENLRGLGVGQLILKFLMKKAQDKWSPYASLTVELTSQEKRGTRKFYEGLGFVSTATNRYKKTIPAARL